MPSERKTRRFVRLDDAVVRLCLLRLSKRLDCPDDQDGDDDSGDASEDTCGASVSDRHTDCQADQDREHKAENKTAAVDESKQGARRCKYTCTLASVKPTTIRVVRTRRCPP